MTNFIDLRAIGEELLAIYPASNLYFCLTMEACLACMSKCLEVQHNG